jgi:endonuclease YncB( thermonuclease family)
LCAVAAPAAEVVPGPVPAEVTGVIDGDTIAVRARIWIGQDVETRVRISGIDAPELRGACDSERALAMAARERLIELVAGGGVTLTGISNDKYGGRVLARVLNGDGVDVGDTLVAARLARAYTGGARASWCD